MAVKTACHAAEVVHPILSRNRDDIHCQIAGHMRPAEGSPCVSALGTTCYTKCPIWRLFKDMEDLGLEKRVLREYEPHPHVLDGVVRDTIRV